MLKKQAWRSTYSDFEQLEMDFYKWHRKRAPNSYKADTLYMTYVFEYFLNIEKSGNVNLWKDSYQKFRDWLEEGAKGTKRNSQSLSYSTINHCIKALNNFTEFCVAYNHLNPDFRVQCKCFPQHLIGKRGYQDVIPLDEFQEVLVAN
jgi:hypothetical protein